MTEFPAEICGISAEDAITIMERRAAGPVVEAFKVFELIGDVLHPLTRRGQGTYRVGNMYAIELEAPMRVYWRGYHACRQLSDLARFLTLPLPRFMKYVVHKVYLGEVDENNGVCCGRYLYVGPRLSLPYPYHDWGQDAFYADRKHAWSVDCEGGVFET
jgi:hypothetical protein